jgi:hypothetical protein
MYRANAKKAATTCARKKEEVAPTQPVQVQVQGPLAPEFRVEDMPLTSIPE